MLYFFSYSIRTFNNRIPILLTFRQAIVVRFTFMLFLDWTISYVLQ